MDFRFRRKSGHAADIAAMSGFDPGCVKTPAVGEAEKGVGQRFESDDRRAVLSIYALENEDDDTPASNLRRIYDNRSSITNGSLAFSLPFQWNGTEQSITAGATSRVQRAVPHIVSIWCIRKRKSGHGILWWHASVSPYGLWNDEPSSMAGLLAPLKPPA
jgi:hypothetical protein